MLQLVSKQKLTDCYSFGMKRAEICVFHKMDQEVFSSLQIVSIYSDTF